MEQVKANKTNLKKIIRWSTSKWNEYKKSEVIEEILKKIKENKDFERTYHTGSYTTSGSLAGRNYKFKMKKDGRITIKESYSNKTYLIIKKR